MKNEVWVMLKRPWFARVCCGLLIFAASANVYYVDAEEAAQDDVAQAKKVVRSCQDAVLALRGRRIMRATGQTLGKEDEFGLAYEKSGKDGSELGLPSTAEMLAAQMICRKEQEEPGSDAIKSIKVAPLTDGKEVVRVLYNDGSVYYYDCVDSEGKTNVENAPSVAEIDAIPEFDCGPGGYANWCHAKMPPLSEDENKKFAIPRVLEPDFERAIKGLAQKRNECLEWLRSSGNGDDRRFALEVIACSFVNENRMASFLDIRRKSAIQSIKIVPLNSPKEWASTYGAVRVLFSDGSVRYYDEDKLDGEREPATAPSEEVVGKTLEFSSFVQVIPWPDEFVSRAKKRLSITKAAQTEATK